MSIYQNKDYLLKAFNEGDVEAFKEVYNKYVPRLVRFARSITNDTLATEDIVADVFVTLYKRKNLFESFHNIQAFLYIITRNSCLDFLRYREKLRKDLSLYAYSLNKISFEDPNHNELLMQHVHAAIEELPYRNREIMKMYYFDQASSYEIAEKLNITLKAVHSHLRHARQRIRESLSNKINLSE